MSKATFLLVLLIMIGEWSVYARKQIGMNSGRGGSRTSSLSSSSSAAAAAAAAAGNDKMKNKTVNICLQNELEGNLFCNCNPGSEKHNSATSANCYIYSQDMRYDDPVWQHFASQPGIMEWKVLVRPDGLLRFVPTPGLQYLPSIRKFSLQYATILDLEPYTFLNRTDLQILNLDRNQIIHITPGAFANLPSLMRLALFENRITELESGTFNGAPQLRNLNLCRNNISLLHDGAFIGLHHLEELDLSYNEISVLTRETFAGMPSLKILDLNYNRVSLLASDTLCLIPKLESLIMTSNEIQLIEMDAFACVPMLRRLELADNNLKSIIPGTLNALNRLHKLDLSDNRLITLEYDTIAPVLENLNHLSSFFSLDDNPLECDCRLLWTFDLLKETKSTSIVTHLNSLKCKLIIDLKTDYDENNFSIEGITTTTTLQPSEDNFSLRSTNIGRQQQQQQHKTNIKEDTNSSRYRKLMNINPMHLPCPVEEVQQPSLEPTMKITLASEDLLYNTATTITISLYSHLLLLLLLLFN